MQLEHGIYAYYGGLGAGKTLAMTRDVIKFLNKGYVVYTNYKINWNGHKQKGTMIGHFLYYLSFKKINDTVQFFPKTNWRYIATDDTFWDKFPFLTNCIVALDEAYFLFDSYTMTKMSMVQRASILQCRKLDKSIFYTTQRPTAVHVVMRGMTNVFFRLSKVRIFVPFLSWFVKSRTEDMDSETVAEEKLKISSVFRGRKYFKMYNTKELVGIDTKKIEDNLPTRFWVNAFGRFSLPARETTDATPVRTRAYKGT